MGYAEVKKIYDRERLDVFVMAISHLMNIGWDTAEQISDIQIEAMEGNGFMTREFCQELNKLVREIALCCHPSELIQLCEAEEVFDVSYSANKIKRTTLEDGLINAINFYLRDTNDANYDEVCEAFGLEPEDLEKLGFEYDWESED